ncbi:two-component system response regulator [Geomonas silvestris]|uniref:Two-component system response regulator n=1 Tax=Geomonas silvestris TaxID=2740184 RepID=A0A6V8MKJ3_9BACT|nr:HD domain-containing phosphohydrolase [Geomonas silvestris]GFO60531.1 two-component system response regulator [Geomonas silvestris]
MQRSGTKEGDGGKVLVVDDEPLTASMLQFILESQGYQTKLLHDGSAVLSTACDWSPDLILLDVVLPGENGFDLCRRLKARDDLREIPVLFISGLDGTSAVVQGFDAGGVDYIAKPFCNEEVLARVGTHLKMSALHERLENQKNAERVVRKLFEAQAATIFAMAKLAEYRDESTGQHLERVRELCRLLAFELGRDSLYQNQITDDFVTCIQHAAPLHDIGKIAIPDAVLLKRGGLSAEEYETIQTHTTIGAETLQSVFNEYPGNLFIGMGIEIALYHHERWDGNGYPDGLVGRNIPLSARIMAVADVYDALRSDRCYRNGLSHERTMAMLVESAGAHFDPEIVKVALRVQSRFEASFPVSPRS